MKTLVVYKSKTGFAKSYAEQIASAAGAQLLDLRSLSPVIISRFDLVVYGGGLYAGAVNGLKKLKAMMAKSSTKKLILFACGATPNEAEESIEKMWAANLTAEERNKIPHFYMQAGLDYEAMSAADRFLMKAVAKLKGGRDSGKNPLLSSHNISSPDFIKPLLDCLK